jgi:hypothetical protein
LASITYHTVDDGFPEELLVKIACVIAALDLASIEQGEQRE